MKKICITVLLCTSVLFAGFADDGGTYHPEDWTYGNIYVKEANQKIALRNELLIVTQAGNDVTALFDFFNTSNEAVTVPCAFPVVVTLPFLITSDGAVSNRIDYTYQPNEDLWDFILGGRKMTKEAVFALDKQLRTMSFKEYQQEKPYYTYCSGCEITQDGKAVPIKTVGVETSVTATVEDFSYYDYKAEGTRSTTLYEVKLVLHFYHELYFKPNAQSNLTVSYFTATAKHSGYRGIGYTLLYDISTGGTWKGAMDSFIVVTDGSMEVHGAANTFECNNLGNMSFKISGDFNLYSVKNYKPVKGEYFTFSTGSTYEDEYYLEDYWEYHWKHLSERESGFQSCIKDIRASSYLDGTYTIAGPDSAGKERNYDKNLRTSTYKPETSFDGILYNGWVEGVKGDGIGEWIEFTLTATAIGPFATNGLCRFSGNKDKSYWGLEDRAVEYNSPQTTVLNRTGSLDGSWRANNRIKTMKLQNMQTNKTLIIDFADTFPQTEDIDIGGYNWRRVNAVKNPVILEPGTYRLSIESVYKGEKWDDTVLGEVWFVPFGPVTMEILKADTNNFFRAPLDAFIASYLLR